MRRILAYWVALAGCCLLAVGCGGGGSGGGVASPFSGTWTTSFTDGDGALIVLRFDVGTAGGVEGEAWAVGENGLLGKSVLFGRVANAGDVALTVRHPDGRTDRPSGTASLVGSTLRLDLVPEPNRTLTLICLPPSREAAAGGYSGTLDLPGRGQFQVSGTLDDSGRFSGTLVVQGQSLVLRSWLLAGSGIQAVGWASKAASNEMGAVFRGEAALGEDSAGRRTISVAIDLLQMYENGQLTNASGTLSLTRQGT